MTAVDLSSLKDKTAIPGEPVEVETAFLVILRGNGVVQATPDINVPITPQRVVTMDEMQMACQRVADDAQATKVAQLVQMGMQQVAQRAMSQAQGQQIAQGLKLR